MIIPTSLGVNSSTLVGQWPESPVSTIDGHPPDWRSYAGSETDPCKISTTERSSPTSVTLARGAEGEGIRVHRMPV